MNRSGKCEGPGGGDRRGALCTGFTLVLDNHLILLWKRQTRPVDWGKMNTKQE